jgi:hypothetical protein
MVRVDGPLNMGGTINWNFGVSMPAGQDINFDGEVRQLNPGSDDWANLRLYGLNQLATRRNLYGMSLDLGRDGLGRGDILGRDGLGRDGLGRDGLGRDGLGRDGLGRDGLGRDGLGRDGLGRDGLGRDGLGGGDGLGRDGLGHDWLLRDVGELDAETAAASGNGPDVTPPVVMPFTTSGYFTTSPVEISVTAADVSTVSALGCTDSLSSITPLELVGIGTPVASGRFSVSGDGTHNLTCTATDPVGNTVIETGTVRIDTAPPTITITSPADQATYYVGAAVAANYSCSDSGSGVVSCVGPVAHGANIDTTTAGSMTFTVNATDGAGRFATKTVTYSVGYNVTLTPLKATAQLGSAVPVIWQVRDAAGNYITSLSTVKKIESVFRGSSPCGTTSPGISETLFESPNYSTGKSSLRYVSSIPGFQFNWDTTSASTDPGRGCYTVLIYLTDQPTGPRETTLVVLK